MTHKLAIAFTTALLTTSSAFAIDAGDLKGQPITEDQYIELVNAAKAVNPPKNGENYVFGFANLGRNAPFFLSVEQGIVDNGEKAGVEILVTDNAFDGSTALANAESYLRRDVDYVIEFQTDTNFGYSIMQKMNEANVKVTAIDIPMPGATFMGANNPRSGFMGGVYLAQNARAKWEDDKVMSSYLVVGELPQSGAVPAMRTDGQVAGFLAEYPEFPEDQLIKIDTKGTLEEGFRVMSDLVGRIPQDVPILGLAINDQSILGMLRAVEQAGRSDEALFVGMGADEGETMVAEPNFLGSVGYFPENYGNYLVPIALMELAGVDVPPAVLVEHKMVTSPTICNFYENIECTDDSEVELAFPETAFEWHLKDQLVNPALADVKDLIPTK